MPPPRIICRIHQITISSSLDSRGRRIFRTSASTQQARALPSECLGHCSTSSNITIMCVSAFTVSFLILNPSFYSQHRFLLDFQHRLFLDFQQRLFLDFHIPLCLIQTPTFFPNSPPARRSISCPFCRRVLQASCHSSLPTSKTAQSSRREWRP